MSKRAFSGQKNSFSGSASQTNHFRRGDIRCGSIALVNGYEVDPRYKRCSIMQATSDGCIIDGIYCELKTIDGKKMWTLEGVEGAPTAARDDVSSTSSFDSDSSESSDEESPSSSSSSSSPPPRKRRIASTKKKPPQKRASRKQ